MSFIESLKRLSGRADTDTKDGGPTSPGATSPKNTWQDVFNPGRNYNRKGSYFDNVPHDGQGKADSIWDQHIQSHNAQEPSSPTHSAGLSGEEIRKLFSSERVNEVLKYNEGKNVDINTFVKQLQGFHGDGPKSA